MKKTLFILFITSFFFSMDAMEEKESLDTTLRVMTYNVCTSFHTYKNRKKKHLLIDKRLDKIASLITDENPDIIAFQEIRNIGHNTLSLFSKLIENLGYSKIQLKENDSDFSLINTIAYKNNSLSFEQGYFWWMSETPDYCSKHMCMKHPKAVLMATFYPKQEKTYCKNTPLYFVNIHHHKNHFIRMRTNQVLVEKIRELTKIDKGFVVIAGDMSTYSYQNYGEKELSILKENGYFDASKYLKTFDGIKVSGTFIGYSNDFHKCPKNKFGDHLDHVFVKNQLPDKQTYETKCHVNDKKYTHLDLIPAETETDLLQGPDGEDIRDEFPSDHLPVIVDITIKKHAITSKNN